MDTCTCIHTCGFKTILGLGFAAGLLHRDGTELAAIIPYTAKNNCTMHELCYHMHLGVTLNSTIHTCMNILLIHSSRPFECVGSHHTGAHHASHQYWNYCQSLRMQATNLPCTAVASINIINIAIVRLQYMTASLLLYNNNY